jgi:hypothetical protein
MSKHPEPSEPTLDLFTAAAARGPQSDTSPVARQSPTAPRYILPNDLPAALTHLSEDELQTLAKAVTQELGRRNSCSGIQLLLRGDQKPQRLPPQMDQKVGKGRPPKAEASPLTQSRINAMRAALKVGVKPTVIARQFGVSLSAIRQALSDKND